jgi:hypothetical protein
MLSVSGCANGDTSSPTSASRSKPPTGDITPGAKGIQIAIGASPSKAINKTSLSWGIQDNRGRFVIAQATQFDNLGGTMRGEISNPNDVSTILVSLAVDYGNEDLPDTTFQFKCALDVNGFNKIFPVTSSIGKTSFLLFYPPAMHQGDRLVLQWAYRDDEDNGTPISADGTKIIDIASLDRAGGRLENDAVYPTPILRPNSGMFSWSISGTVKGQALKGKGLNGRVLRPPSTITLIIDNSGGVNTVNSPPPPGEDIVGQPTSLVRDSCREMPPRGP